MGGNLITMGMASNGAFDGIGSCYMGKQKCNTNSEMDCRQARVVYRAECKIFKMDPNCLKDSVYIGTSGCTLHKRTLEHQSLTAKPTNNAQSKHHWSKHPNQQPSFTTEVIRSGIKYNTDRFIFEALKI